MAKAGTVMGDPPKTAFPRVWIVVAIAAVLVIAGAYAANQYLHRVTPYTITVANGTTVVDPSSYVYFSFAVPPNASPYPGSSYPFGYLDINYTQSGKIHVILMQSSDFDKWRAGQYSPQYEIFCSSLPFADREPISNGSWVLVFSNDCGNAGRVTMHLTLVLSYNVTG